MKTTVVIDGVEEDLEIVVNGDGSRYVRLQGGEHNAHLVECESGVFSVLVGGCSFEVVLESGNAVWIGPTRRQVELRDPRRWNPGGSRGGAGGPETIKAAMPGKVVRTLVTAGEAVQTGQALLVVEAMKMQNEVKSPKTGIVLRLEVQPGDSVAAGEALAVVE